MLSYLYQEGVEPCSTEPLKVRLERRIIGEIRKVVGGYRYVPKGKKEAAGGDIFQAVTDVQKSLAAAD